MALIVTRHGFFYWNFYGCLDFYLWFSCFIVCVCLCIYRCMCRCVHVCGRQSAATDSILQGWLPVFFFFDTEVSYWPKIYQIGLPDRLVSIRDMPVSISLALGLQVYVPSLSFLNVSFGSWTWVTVLARQVLYQLRSFLRLNNLILESAIK